MTHPHSQKTNLSDQINDARGEFAEKRLGSIDFARSEESGIVKVTFWTDADG